MKASQHIQELAEVPAEEVQAVFSLGPISRHSVK